jgi:hypothetical protein
MKIKEILIKKHPKIDEWSVSVNFYDDNDIYQGSLHIWSKTQPQIVAEVE